MVTFLRNVVNLGGMRAFECRVRACERASVQACKRASMQAYKRASVKAYKTAS